jgi:hypothetical protein
MMEFVRPTTQLMARKAHVLLDTEDRYDAWSTGRERPESLDDDGCGLRIAYDGTGTVPSMTINGPDGEIELCGVDEIRAVNGAMRSGLRYAEAFGDPIPYPEWRKLHG